MDKSISDAELAQAFTSGGVEPKQKPKSAKRAPIVVMIIGLIVLVAGVVVLLMNVLAKPAMRDAEYLVEIGSWERKDEPSVVWDFTEIGKGSLTTDSHGNDYDFRWALEDGVLKIETEWLYTFNDDYNYALDQSTNVLTISTDAESWTFVPADDDREKLVEDASIEDMVER